MESASVDYSRQASLPLTIPDTVFVVGCGGVGSWVAYLLALSGVRNLYLFDGDDLSESNLNRILLPPTSVGEQKSNQIAQVIRRLRPDITVVALGNFTPELGQSLLDAATQNPWLIASTDSHKSRQMCHQWCQESGFHYLEAAAEGDYGSATGEPADFVTPEEEHPGYASVPVWAGPCLVAAYLAVNSALHNHNPGAEAVRLGWNQGSGIDFLKR